MKSFSLRTQGSSEWSEGEDEQLRILVLLQRISSWKTVAEHLPERTPQECKKRWSVIRPPSNFEITERRKWSTEEDQKLTRLVKKYGTKHWRIIASHLKGRLPKQCRERWINHVDPDISKGRLTEADWEVVVQAQREYGNRWSEIAKLLPGRTPNQIKNHWHAMARRKQNIKRKRSSDDEESDQYGEETSTEDNSDNRYESPSRGRGFNSKRRCLSDIGSRDIDSSDGYYNLKSSTEPESSDEMVVYSSRSPSPVQNNFRFNEQIIPTKLSTSSRLDILCEMAEALYQMEMAGTDTLQSESRGVDKYTCHETASTSSYSGIRINNLLNPPATL